MYLTPAAIGCLSQLVLAALIGGYFALAARRIPGRPTHTCLLAAFFAVLSVLIALLFLEASLLYTGQLVAVYLISTVLAVAAVLLIQFAYHFPELPARQRWEARAVLALGSLYAAWEAGFAVYRFSQLAAGQVLYRPDVADLAPALLLAWVPIVLVRRAVRLSAAEGAAHPLRHLWRPQGRPARAARAFAAICAFVAVLAGGNVLLTFYAVSRAFYSGVLSAGILFALFAFAVTYLNHLPEHSSFLVRLAGGSLASLLAVLGLVGSVVAPTYAAHFDPDLPDGRALRFTPNAAGGYDVAEMPLRLETGAGVDLHLTDGRERRGMSIDFTFPFYGRTYDSVFVTNDGSLGIGHPLTYHNYQYRYGGGTPMIYPLLLDLYPEIGAGGIFARREADRLIVTWQRVPAYFAPQQQYTFQAVLYTSGEFHLAYDGLPARPPYLPDDEPGATPWLLGALPPWPGRSPRLVSFTSLPQSGGPDGLLQDYHLDFRRYLHALYLRLGLVVLAGGLALSAAVPLVFRANLSRPLADLLAGVRQMNAGHYGRHIEVRYPDEIGFLTRSFNATSAEMGSLIHNLEDRVEQRTVELQLANNRLAQEIAELDAFAHTVAHDLKSPLTIVITGTEILSGEIGTLRPDEVQAVARMAGTAARRATAIVDSLLLLARARKSSVEAEPLAMAPLVNQARQQVAQALADCGAEVVDAGLDLAPTALGYGPWIVQVWVNYISNAAKYGGRPPRIELGGCLEKHDTPPGAAAGPITEMLPEPQVRFWVRDNGRGLSAAEQARLFTPFERLGQVMLEGQGLGLSIAKRIVEKLGGRVGIESAPGQGSLFYFTLPAAPAVGKDE